MGFLHDPMSWWTVMWSASTIIAIILISGYCLTLAVFPKKNEIDMPERLGMSIILGFTPFLLLYFFDKNLNIPINFATTLFFILLTCAAGLAVWFLRKRRVPSS